MSEPEIPTEAPKTNKVAEGLETAGTVAGCVPALGGIAQGVLGGGAAVARAAGGDFKGAALTAGSTIVQAGLSEITAGGSDDVIALGKFGKIASGAAKIV